ncbi:hypothetical protein GOBAR_DD05718 [Gossypium barbadense]|nr:hypothetical protein GOBAR_DD05718 [Gossypium barbadense]
MGIRGMMEDEMRGKESPRSNETIGLEPSRDEVTLDSFYVKGDNLEGISGGLTVWWEEEVESVIFSACKNIIDMKEEGRFRSEKKMEGFRRMIEECGFIDLHFSVIRFSWVNKREDGLIKERIDRALVNIN